MKAKVILSGLVLTSLGVGIGLYNPYFMSYLDSNYVGQYPTSFPTEPDNNIYLHQSKNNCGPYVVTTLVQLLKTKNRNPEYVVQNINFRVPNEFTLPLGIKDYIRKEGLKTRELNLLDVSNEKKIQVLKYNLSRGRKIVSIIKPTKAQPLQLHYVLILGYDENNFHIYDPGIRRSMIIGYTEDRNGEIIGNKSLSHQELIYQMNNGHILGVAKDYALLAWN
jgi:hypothetical protein